MDICEVNIPAIDGFNLSALLIKPTKRSKGVVQFHPGTLAVKEFYLDFCKYISEKGYTVILFDYRGIGKSRPESLKNFKASLIEWGSLDMTGVLKWAVENFPKQKKIIIAHSMGGQLIGFMENHHLIDGIACIASSYGNWKNYSGINKLISAIMWLSYFPCSIFLKGYLPLKYINKGEDLPKGVAWQLWRWCLRNNALSDKLDRKNIKHYFYDIRNPLKAYYIEDDIIATLKTIPLYKKDYKNALLDIQIIKPEIVHAKIGHYGFFKKKFADILWKDVVHWIDGI